jgi:hypothetical protein
VRGCAPGVACLFVARLAAALAVAETSRESDDQQTKQPEAGPRTRGQVKAKVARPDHFPHRI